MDDAKIGRSLRVLRQRRHLRQADVAAAAGVSQPTVSIIERGHASSLSVATLRRVFGAVDAGFEGIVVWRGASLDRLLDERHSHLVGEVARRLTAMKWTVALEVTYSVYGERGSIDVLARHISTGVCLVVEVKTELASLEELGRKTDEKVRLARRHLCAERFGTAPLVVAKLLVLPDTDAARGAARRHGAVLDVMFPTRAENVRAWLRMPTGAIGGLQFVANMNPRSANRPGVGVSRVRAPAGNVTAAVRRPLALQIQRYHSEGS